VKEIPKTDAPPSKSSGKDQVGNKIGKIANPVKVKLSTQDYEAYMQKRKALQSKK
jgi:hypothetical protein